MRFHVFLVACLESEQDQPEVETSGRRHLRDEPNSNSAGLPQSRRDCRKQAIAQACVVSSPFFGMMSAIAMLQHLSVPQPLSCRSFRRMKSHISSLPDDLLRWNGHRFVEGGFTPNNQ